MRPSAAALISWHDSVMSFCEHCQGQRYDRANVMRELRALRRTFREQRRRPAACEALDAAIRAVRRLEIPHLERLDDEVADGEIVH
jgi:hypothetical protein